MINQPYDPWNTLAPVTHQPEALGEAAGSLFRQHLGVPHELCDAVLGILGGVNIQQVLHGAHLSRALNRKRRFGSQRPGLH